MTIFYLLPTCIQFGAFSLWAVFFARVTFGNAKFICKPIVWYIIINSILLILDLVLYGLSQSSSSKSHAGFKFFQDLEEGFACFVHFLLSILLFIFGIRFARLSEKEYHKTHLPRKPIIVIASTFTLSFLFLLRGIYNLLSSTGIWRLPDFPPVTAVTIVFFLVMDLLPLLVCLLLTFTATGSQKKATTGESPLIGTEEILDAPFLARFQDVNVESSGRSVLLSEDDEILAEDDFRDGRVQI